MTRDKKILFFTFLAVTAAVSAAIYWGFPLLDRALSKPEGAGESVGYPAETAKARVLAVVEEGILNNFGSPRPYQILSVEVLEGPYRGMVTDIDLGIRQFHTESMNVKPGETLLVMINLRMDTGDVSAHFIDFERSRSLLWLFAAFVLVSVVISGWKGIRSLIGIIFSLGMIIFFIIPQILAGKDPVLVSILGGFAFLSVTMYLVYGWNLKTHSAVMGIFLALSITGLLSVFFVDFTRLSGFGNENAMFLVQQNAAPISMRGLLLAGMLIGSLGVLDDLVISQASAVFELHAANSKLNLKFLYRRGMNIGRDHVAATINTLVLAYAGSSLPMLLLFSINSGDYVMLANMSMVAEEIVRTLVGSIGLFLAVPITTFLSSLLVLHRERLGWIRRFLGPENHWETHSGHIH
jgi:uncharacterized membrane protein